MVRTLILLGVGYGVIGLFVSSAYAFAWYIRCERLWVDEPFPLRILLKTIILWPVGVYYIIKANRNFDP